MVVADERSSTGINCSDVDVSEVWKCVIGNGEDPVVAWRRMAGTKI